MNLLKFIGMLVLSVGPFIAVCVAHMRAKDQASEADGAEADGGVQHVCYRCRCHISGPYEGTPTSDCLCFDCWAKTPANDDGAVPSYVHHHHEPVTTP